MFVLAIFSLICLAFEQSLAKEEWPQWRGPTGQGHANAKGLPLEWSEKESVVWKTPIEGRGHSSPVISGNQIWLTTSVVKEADEDDKEKRLKKNTGNQPLVVAASVTFRAICLDRKTGKKLHDVELWTAEKPQWVHALNSYASPSPILADGKLYCHFGSFGTGCVDSATGKVLWTNRDLAVMHENGPGSTPVLWKDRLILTFDGSDKQFVAALDAATGQLEWKTNRSGKLHANPQLKKAYATPIVIDIDGKPHVVSPGADWLYAYDPQDGSEVWKVPFGELGFSIVPRPVVGHGMIYMSTSFMQPQILAIRYADGDKSTTPKIAWRHKKQAPKMPSPILVGDELYFVSDSGIATCVDAKTGKLHWQKRLGGNFCASPLYADGKIYMFNREGTCTVIKPGTEFKQLASNELDGGFYASAAAVDGALYLRTDKAMYRVEAR